MAFPFGPYKADPSLANDAAPTRIGVSSEERGEFMGGPAAKARGHAAGVLYVAPDGRILLLLRSPEEENFGGHWALPGGKAERGETPATAAYREASEEMGAHIPAARNTVVLDQRMTPTNMAFHTFCQAVDEQFAPVLNFEHAGYGWFDLTQLPAPLHPAVADTIKARAGRDGLALQKWAAEPQPDHAFDEALAFYESLAFDRKPEWVDLKLDVRSGLAFDRQTARSYSKDGHLHIVQTNISKATVNPYIGREIPGWQSLGLQPDRVYKLLRHPEELKKAAESFNNKPLLSQHKHTTAKDHQHDLTIGTMSGVTYDHPYLKADLAVWSQPDIDGIEADKKREISSSYHYRADMTQGVFEGEAYDGVMRDIVGNHAAMVEDGRAGSDVAARDEAPNLSEIIMSKAVNSLKASVAVAAIGVILKPLLAKDAKLDLGPAFKDVKRGNFAAQRKSIVDGVKVAMDGKMAKDSDVAAIIENVAEVVEMINADKTVSDAVEPDASEMAGGTTDDSGLEAIKAYLKEKGVPDEVIAALPAMGTAEDEDDDDGKKKDEGKKDEKKDDDKPPAMDAAAVSQIVEKAVTTAVETERKRNAATTAAREACRPHVGDLLGMDSADAIYAHTLTTLGVEGVKDIHPSAYPGMLKALAAAKPATQSTTTANDSAISAPGGSLLKRIPHLAKITVR